MKQHILRLLNEMGQFKRIDLARQEGKQLNRPVTDEDFAKAKDAAWNAGRTAGSGSTRSELSRVMLGNLIVPWPHTEHRDHYYDGFKIGFNERKAALK